MTDPTMRAAVIDRLGKGPTYREIPRPVPGPGQVLVQVQAAALNPVDLRLATGGHLRGVPTVPYVPGSEGVGTVVAGGSPLQGKRVRFQVIGSPSGSLAEWAAVDAATCLLIPDELPAATAAGLGVAGMAAWISLVDKIKLQRGERVLILGATGIVGQVAVQIAKLLGAGRIVASGRDLTALANTLELGADAVVAVAGQSVEALRDSFAAAARGPIDVVFDPVWGTPLQAALGAVGLSARIVNVGESASDEATLSSAIVRGRQLTIIGHTNPNTSWAVRARAFRELAEHAAEGRIRIEIEELPLSEIAVAWERQASSPHVKLVLIPAT
ncbi:MAG: zinc-binding alcohol dehydrogenase family protein [Candidatus Dormiibacterota bacterium]